MSYMEQNTGKLALGMLALIACMFATIFWYWLLYVDVALAAALALPVYRWYAELFFGI